MRYRCNAAFWPALVELSNSNNDGDRPTLRHAVQQRQQQVHFQSKSIG